MMALKDWNFQSQQRWLVGLVSVALVTGCSGAPIGSGQDELTAAPEAGSVVGDQAALTAEVPANERVSDRSPAVPTASAARAPQLIKHASLRLALPDVDAAIASISEILTRHQGDLLQLSDYDGESRAPRQVSLQIRVPQTQLDGALESLRNLGTVTNQSISAEDVSTQLVDLQARIRNLRQSEAALLEIMERSGSIADVLEVTRELTAVRETIERNDAQLKSLQNQVAYSTISITLVSTQVPAPTVSPVSEALSQTWTTATTSVRSLSVGLLKLMLWLLAFSPYIGVLLLTGWTARRYWTRQHRTDIPANSTEAS